MGLEYSEQNWIECLESLNFTEQPNVSFGGMQIYDDNGIPKWQYDTEEGKKRLYLFFSGAVYMKIHMMFN